MITPEQAKPMCKAIVEKFVQDYECETADDIASVLTGLASMCSIGIATAVDHKLAAYQMLRIADKHLDIAKLDKEQK